MSDKNDRTPTLHDVMAVRRSRRDFVGGSLAAVAATATGGIGFLLQSVPASARRGDALVRFQSIPVSSDDVVTVPAGYLAKVLIAWGDPVSNGPAFRQDASNSAADQALQWGMHNDGLAFFSLEGSDRGLLVQNNEYTDDVLLFRDGTANWNQSESPGAANDPANPKQFSSWPDGAAGGRPRSACLVITKVDGDEIGT